jgi:hypothetical protein
MNVSGFELTVKSAVYEYMDTASDQVYTFIVTPTDVTVLRTDPTPDGQPLLLQGYDIATSTFIHITELTSYHHFADLESAVAVIPNAN